jgi:hypothetical protein
MDGYQRAMDGNCHEATRPIGKSSSLERLAACLMLSLGIHSMLLILQVSQTGSAAGAYAIEERSESGRLQVFLAPRVGENHVKHIPADTGSIAVNSGSPVRESSMRGLGVGFSGVLPEREPELVSEIDSEINDPRVRGFMILHLQIDDSGAVDAADVIYSELPSGIAELLVERFALARFKPAVRKGKVAEASILLRIDIN